MHWPSLIRNLVRWFAVLFAVGILLEQLPEITYAYRKWHELAQAPSAVEFYRKLFVGQAVYNLIVIGLGISIFVALKSRDNRPPSESGSTKSR